EVEDSGEDIDIAETDNGSIDLLLLRVSYEHGSSRVGRKQFFHLGMLRYKLMNDVTSCGSTQLHPEFPMGAVDSTLGFYACMGKLRSALK
ncbi:hypothetical protein STEG23_028699, partial [Scotinomys teguina]